MGEESFSKVNLNGFKDGEFKEDSVREELILPILHTLGYSADGLNKIIRSKTLRHPFIETGSKRKELTNFPDYILVVENKYAWVLDAKAPDEEIVSGDNVEQVYFYAIHPEVRVNLFALCNGKEFVVFKIDQPDPVLYFHLSEIEKHWDSLLDLLSPEAFKSKKKPLIDKKDEEKTFDYGNIKQLPEIRDLKKQSAKRHYGVHGYFTKQVWNVVQDYIKNFTMPGDVVLDPFGGSGVTLVEALILGRKAIHIDINPLAIFMVKNLISPTNISLLFKEYKKIEKAFEKAPVSAGEVQQALTKYKYPKNIRLPKNSDVETVDQLFDKTQLAQLAYLKSLITKVRNKDVQGTLMLMFSGLLNKINLTYHASSGRSEGRGNSGVFAYYRYRLAPKPANLDIMTYFEKRLKKLILAKRVFPIINENTIKNAQVYKGSATNLNFIAKESIDYIYTDPPYGRKIQYLDLSTMWNAWLDLPVTNEDYELEAIEGGSRNKSKREYSDLLIESLEETYRVLKFDRWMSFVFAHKDPAYWHLIVESAEKIGFEYMGAVRQSNDKTTFKKRQNPFTVLSGQLIINFKKVKTPKAIMKVDLGADITSIIMETIEGIIAQNDGATLEEINNELIIKGLELGFLDILSKEFQDITPVLNAHFTLDSSTGKYHIPQNNKFRSRIDVRVRVRYFLLSFLKRMEYQHYSPTFDEIILHIMPLLKNGITPEEQTILKVLEKVANRAGDGRWKLMDQKQLAFSFL